MWHTCYHTRYRNVAGCHREALSQNPWHRSLSARLQPKTCSWTSRNRIPLYSSTIQYPNFASQFQRIFLTFLYQLHFYLLILRHYFSTSIRCCTTSFLLESEPRMHWKFGQPSLPARAGITLRFTYFTCTVLQIFRQAVVLIEEKTWPSRNVYYQFNRPSLHHRQFQDVHTLLAQFSTSLLIQNACIFWCWTRLSECH